MGFMSMSTYIYIYIQIAQCPVGSCDLSADPERPSAGSNRPPNQASKGYGRLGDVLEGLKVRVMRTGTYKEG